MFDLNAKDGSVRKKPYTSPIPIDQPAHAAGSGPAASKLDSAEAVDLHHRLLDLYTRELDRQYANRAEQAEDDDFYDNIQWKEEDAQELRDRGQLPLVYNVISASIDWVTGTEKRARTDFNILPRRKAEAKPAERKTQLLKYLSDVNREPFHISRAFEDTARVGIGWIEDGLQDEDEDEALYTRYESWRNMLWDSAATELDISDGRYMFRSKWLDVDIARTLFSKRHGVIDAAAANADDFIALDQYGDVAMDSHELEMENAGQSMTSDRILGYQRQRVRVIEAWIRIPKTVEKIRGGTFSGEIFDPSSIAHIEEIESGNAEKHPKSAMRMHVVIFTSAGLLWASESPYRHNRFPFTPIWGYRRGRDGMPYGIIRRLKDIQTDVNKRASKALYILSTSKIIMDDDALPADVSDEEFLAEVSRPDAVIKVKSGKRLEINADRDLSQWHLELMSRSISMVQQASGVTDELMGRRTNATSGIAIQRRQDQGSMTTAKLFDNLLFAQQVHGEKLLANIEQFISEEKSFRITDMKGRPDYASVNDGLPENDITRTKADFVISEAAWHASIRQAAAEQLLEAASRMPGEVVLQILDLIVENMDLPNREEIVKRIRSINGQRDPDAQEPTQEEIQKAQKAQMLEQAQMAEFQAKLRKMIADAVKAEADAKKSQAGAEQIIASIVGEKVDQEQKALDAAITALSAPAATDIADHILAEAGFVSKSDQQAAAADLLRKAMAARAGAPQPSQPGSPPMPGPAQPAQQADTGQTPGAAPNPQPQHPAGAPGLMLAHA